MLAAEDVKIAKLIPEEAHLYRHAVAVLWRWCGPLVCVEPCSGVSVETHGVGLGDGSKGRI